MTTDAPTTRFARLLDTLWVDEGGLRSLWIEGGTDGPRVSVWRGLGSARLLTRCPGRWHPHREPGSAVARRRLDVLQVEAGDVGLGSTYDLMLARENRDPAAFDGMRYVTADDETPLDDLRLFPEVGGSFYDAVLGADDPFAEDERDTLGWAQPYRTYHIATASERAMHPIAAPK